MKRLQNYRFGKSRIINYRGEVNMFGDDLAAAALEDPELERQITVAALSLQYTRMARHVGEQMIAEILNHHS